MIPGTIGALGLQLGLHGAAGKGRAEPMERPLPSPVTAVTGTRASCHDRHPGPCSGRAGSAHGRAQRRSRAVQNRLGIAVVLELEPVAGGILQKERPVLQRFTAEAALRVHTKGFAEGIDPLPQAPPVLERREDQAEMAGVDPRLWRLRFAAAVELVGGYRPMVSPRDASSASRLHEKAPVRLHRRCHRQA